MAKFHEAFYLEEEDDIDKGVEDLQRISSSQRGSSQSKKSSSRVIQIINYLGRNESHAKNCISLIALIIFMLIITLFISNSGHSFSQELREDPLMQQVQYRPRDNRFQPESRMGKNSALNNFVETSQEDGPWAEGGIPIIDSPRIIPLRQSEGTEGMVSEANHGSHEIINPSDSLASLEISSQQLNKGIPGPHESFQRGPGRDIEIQTNNLPERHEDPKGVQPIEKREDKDKEMLGRIRESSGELRTNAAVAETDAAYVPKGYEGNSKLGNQEFQREAVVDQETLPGKMEGGQYTGHVDKLSSTERGSDVHLKDEQESTKDLAERRAGSGGGEKTLESYSPDNGLDQGGGRQQGGHGRGADSSKSEGQAIELADVHSQKAISKQSESSEQEDEGEKKRRTESTVNEGEW